jgi:hypothetical protein
MRIVSANLNQRLGSAPIRDRVGEWLAFHAPDLFVAQEPFRQSSSARPQLSAYRLIATSELTSCWVAEHLRTPAVQKLADRWQKVLLQGLIVHNVYLDPYSSKARRDLLEAIERDIADSPAAPTIVIGDFNLAPRPEDGMFGQAPSTFTTAGERKALASLMATRALYDATCPAAGCLPAFTFERITKGQPSKFRCDLAVLSESLRSSVTVSYDHSVRKGPGAFTDHSALIIDVSVSSIRVGQGQDVLESRRSKATVHRGQVWTAAEVAKASHKTAIRRSEPSQIARNLVAQGVLKTLGVRRVLDFGCAYGVDAEFYREQGLDAHGYDVEPQFGRADMPEGVFDLVTVVYVVNVLPTLNDRLNVIRLAAEKVNAGGYLLVVARSESAIAREAQRGKWKPFSDGWISSLDKGTFQKGIPHSELAWLLGAVGMPVAPCGLRCSAEVAWIMGQKSAGLC